MRKTTNGTIFNITRAGYLYVSGKKLNTRPLHPFYRAAELIKDNDIQKAVDEWIWKNYVMTALRR